MSDNIKIDCTGTGTGTAMAINDGTYKPLASRRGRVRLLNDMDFFGFEKKAGDVVWYGHGGDDLVTVVVGHGQVMHLEIGKDAVKIEDTPEERRERILEWARKQPDPTAIAQDMLDEIGEVKP